MHASEVRTIRAETVRIRGSDQVDLGKICEVFLTRRHQMLLHLLPSPSYYELVEGDTVAVLMLPTCAFVLRKYYAHGQILLKSTKE